MRERRDACNGDGRALEEHVELLRTLRDEDRLEQLVAFDRLDRGRSGRAAFGRR